MARRGSIVPYSRDYRRPPRWGLGLPPRKPLSWWRRLLRRILDPIFYLRVVIVLAGLGLIILPYGADLVTAALHRVDSVDGTCRVLVVVDGDTVKLVCPERGVETARLLGFDTPEKFSPKCLDEMVKAEKAAWALRVMLMRADRLELSREGEPDRYGRSLVRLVVDGEDVARRMIKDGHARTYGGGLRGSWC